MLVFARSNEISNNTRLTRVCPGPHPYMDAVSTVSNCAVPAGRTLAVAASLRHSRNGAADAEPSVAPKLAALTTH